MNVEIPAGLHQRFPISTMNTWWMSEYPSYASSQIPVGSQNAPYGGRPFSGMWSVTPPSQMPWTAQPVSRFTGTSTESTSQPSTSSEPYVTFGKPVKRRVDTSSFGPVQKQLITEEKVTETLRSLSLNDNEGWLMPPKVDVGPKLVLSEEVKKFHEQEEEIIPASILKSYERPCNALVLWKPPGGGVRDFISEARLQNDASDESSLEVDNNNSVMPDMNLFQNWNGLVPPANPPMNEEEMAD